VAFGEGFWCGMTPLFHVILVEPGPNRLKVILRVRELLGLSLVEARRHVDSGEVILAIGGYMERYLHDLRDEFTKLGAVVKMS
jgi:ribosomal protein L7/L12